MSKKKVQADLGILCQGQGTQKPGMFKSLLTSTDEHVRRAAGEVLEGLVKAIKPEIFDIYYDDATAPAKLNSTVNVQPAIAAATMVWHKALGYTVGEPVVPDVGGGYSLGDFVATNMLGVLSDHDTLSLAALRGEVFITIKPGQFYILTLFTKDNANVNRELRGTGYRATVRNAPDVVTIAGPSSSREEMETRLAEMKSRGIVTRERILDKDLFYVPFHHTKDVADVAGFFKSQVAKYCKRESNERGQHVFMDPEGVFVTNDGRKLTSGTDIMHYLESGHIKNLCDFNKTMRIVGGLAGTVIGFGDLNFQKRTALERGYMKDFVMVNDLGGLAAAASVYEGILQRRTASYTLVASPTRATATRQPATG